MAKSKPMKLVQYVTIGGTKGNYDVNFVVHNQSFVIMDVLDTRKEAEWWRDQFINALKVMVEEVTD